MVLVFGNLGCFPINCNSAKGSQSNPSGQDLQHFESAAEPCQSGPVVGFFVCGVMVVAGCSISKMQYTALSGGASQSCPSVGR